MVNVLENFSGKKEAYTINNVPSIAARRYRELVRNTESVKYAAGNAVFISFMLAIASGDIVFDAERDKTYANELVGAERADFMLNRVPVVGFYDRHGRRINGNTITFDELEKFDTGYVEKKAKKTVFEAPTGDED